MYLYGLRANHMASKLWFKDYELWLYIDKSVKEHDYLMKYISSFTEPSFVIKDCSPKHHPMFERYRPMIDDSVDITVCRDIDSVLSKEDADNINAFIEREDKDVFCYQEYMMSLWSMGGGFCIKKGIIKEWTQVYGIDRDRDEEPLHDLIEKYTTEERRIIVKTRMFDNGVYCLIDSEEDKPKNCKILWAFPTIKMVENLIPFFHRCNGIERYVNDIINRLMRITDEKIDVLLHPNEPINKEKFIDDWFR